MTREDQMLVQQAIDALKQAYTCLTNLRDIQHWHADAIGAIHNTLYDLKKGM